MYYVEIRVDEKIAPLNARVCTISAMKDIVLTGFIIHRRTLLCQIADILHTLLIRLIKR